MVSRGTVAALAIGGVAAAAVGALLLSQVHAAASLDVNPSSAQVGQTITFTATGSFSAFNWDFGDGTVPATTSIGSITHAYTSPGTFAVSCAATASDGTQTVLSAQVTIILASAQNVSTSITSVDSPDPSQVGAIVNVTGSLIRNDTGVGIQNAIVSIESSPTGASWTSIATTMTDTNGQYSTGVVFTMAGTFYIRASYAGGPV